MKILFLANIPSPYRVDFFQEWGKYCDLTVLYEMEAASDRNQEWKSEQVTLNYKPVFLKPVWKQADSAFCPEVKKYLNRDLYDIIIVGVYSTPTGIAAIRYMKKHNIPFVISADGGFVPKAEKKWKYRFKKALLGSAGHWLSSGKTTDEYLLHYGAKQEEIYRYPFTSLFQDEILKELPNDKTKQKIRQEKGIKGQKVILYVGSFIRRKNCETLLHAAALLPEGYEVCLVGGKPPKEYRDIIEKEKLQNISFFPFQKKEPLKNFYLAADLFVLPTREDIWGLVVNEAMAFGLPVVTTTECGAGRELLNGNGLLVECEDVQGLADAILQVLGQDKVREEMSKKSLELIREYTIENMAITHQQIAEKIAAEDKT